MEDEMRLDKTDLTITGTGALTVNVDQIADSGTFSNWTVSLGALPAAGASLPPAVALSIL